jgi:hypothetical protein
MIAKILQLAISLAAGLTAARLATTGLHRRYPVLFTYMAFVALYGIAPDILDTRGSRYFWTWVFCEPVQWTLDILVVRELCRVILEKYPGLATMGRWTMYAGVAIVAFFSFLSLLPHIHSTMSRRSRVLAYWMATGRGVTFALVIFLLLMLLALSRYPVHLSRNVILNALLFTLVFLFDSLEALLRTIFDVRMSPWLSDSLAAVQVVWLSLWFLRLSQDGEHRQFDWIRFRPDYERRMLDRLDALNSVLGAVRFTSTPTAAD